LRAPAAAAAAAASCTRLTPRCSGGDLRCGCQVPNTLQSLGGGLVEAAAEANDLLTGDGGRGGSDVVDDGEGLSWRRVIRRRVRPQHGAGRNGRDDGEEDDQTDVEECGEGDAFSEVVSSSSSSLWATTSEEEDEDDEAMNSHSRLVVSSPSSSLSSSSSSWSSSSEYPSSSSSLSATTAATAACLVLVLISCCAVQPTAACSSRSTPKPRPPSQSAIRPNITFQTYACPPAYAAWYCLNGATCFTVKIADSILYNCECADGYMGQRCEFKDLDGTYLPTRERLIAELSNSRPGQIFLGSMFVILAAAGISAIFTKRRTKSKGKGNRDSFDDANEGDFAGDSSSHDNEEEDNNHRNHHLDDSGIGSCDIFPTSVVGSSVPPGRTFVESGAIPAVQSISYTLSRQHQLMGGGGGGHVAHAQYYGNCHNSPWSSMPEGRYYGHNNENVGLRRQH